MELTQTERPRKPGSQPGSGLGWGRGSLEPLYRLAWTPLGRRNDLFILSLVLLGLAGCQSQSPGEPVIRTVEVGYAVYIPCGAKVDKPMFDDDGLDTAIDIFVASKLAKAGIIQRKQYESELEKALATCNGVVDPQEMM